MRVLRDRGRWKRDIGPCRDFRLRSDGRPFGPIIAETRVFGNNFLQLFANPGSPLGGHGGSKLIEVVFEVEPPVGRAADSSDFR